MHLFKEEAGLSQEPKDWVKIVGAEFIHPAVVLWRAAELAHLEKILKKYPPFLLMLDLGCAEGKIGGMLFEGKGIYGLDNCWDLIRKNNGRNNTYKGLVLADAHQMPFRGDYFSCVFSNCVVEHIADLKVLLSQVHSILNPRGLFVFSVPSNKFGDFLFFSVLFKKLRLKKLADWYSKKRNSMLLHFHCYGHDKWREELANNDFTMLEYAYYLPKRSVMLWDFLAASVFVFEKMKIFSFLLKHITRGLGSVLKDYSNLEAESGGGLIIVAKKYA